MKLSRNAWTALIVGLAACIVGGPVYGIGMWVCTLVGGASGGAK